MIELILLVVSIVWWSRKRQRKRSFEAVAQPRDGDPHNLLGYLGVKWTAPSKHQEPVERKHGVTIKYFVFFVGLVVSKVNSQDLTVLVLDASTSQEDNMKSTNINTVLTRSALLNQSERIERHSPGFQSLC